MCGSTRPRRCPHALFAVVNDQLSAFRAADYASAYSYAANGMQQKFTLPQFERMVRRNYADMAEARRVEFGSVRLDGATATVQVFFFKRTARCAASSTASRPRATSGRSAAVEKWRPRGKSRRPAGSLA